MLVARLTGAGYLASLLRSVAEALLKKERIPDSKKEREEVARPAIMPYICRCVPPKPEKAELLSVVRKIASKAECDRRYVFEAFEVPRA